MGSIEDPGTFKRGNLTAVEECNKVVGMAVTIGM